MSDWPGYYSTARTWVAACNEEGNGSKLQYEASWNYYHSPEESLLRTMALNSNNPARDLIALNTIPDPSINPESLMLDSPSMHDA
jgi:hypothetical protein